MLFSSKLAIEILKARSVNPLVNTGAIASVSLIKAGSEKERWSPILNGMSNYAGKSLELMDKVYQSDYTTAWSNRGIANNLYNYLRLYSEPVEALRVYTKKCSVGLTTKQMTITETMFVTLWNGNFIEGIVKIG